MKISIDVGAYGWRKESWTTTFYPEDLPAGGMEDGSEDWRLAYYSDYFNAVMIPAEYWCDDAVHDCESWLEDVHSDFRFFIEIRQDMHDFVSLEVLSGCLKRLRPQLSALVFLPVLQIQQDSELQYDDQWKNRLLNQLFDDLCVNSSPGIYIDETEDFPELDSCWIMPSVEQRNDVQQFMQNLVFLKDDLTDLRQARRKLESVLELIEDDGIQQNDKKLTVIVDHPGLQADDLRRFRSMLDIMGH